MLNFKKSFEKGINADDNLRALAVNESLNVENLRIGVSGLSKNLTVTNIPSTELIYYYNYPGTNKCIGRCNDLSRQRIIWFNYNSDGAHSINAYDLNEEIVYVVLLDSQVEGGLNFDSAYRIERECYVIGDLLVYTDNNGEPKCINIERGIKLNQPSYVTDYEAYATPIEYTAITLIKRPPIYVLEADKITDGGFDGNLIQDNAYQFFYRYQYKDYQYSCLSAFSQLIPFNYEADTYNAINIKVPFTEDIPDYVQSVEIGVRYGNTGQSFIIQQYNKDNYYDRVAISDHNAGATQLGFTFYDNIIGEALDAITANTSFHSVALTAKTLSVARNRLYLGNVLKGYDTPNTSSLNATLSTFDTGGAGTYLAQWKYFYLTYQYDYFPYATGQIQFYFAYASTANPTSYYYDTYKYSPTPPPTLNAADATSSWATETQIASYVQRNTSPPAGARWTNTGYTFTNSGATTNIIVTVDVGNIQFFKSKSRYYISIAFFDRFRRKCGVIRDVITIDTSTRTFAQSVFSSTILWTLSNADAANEIPDWAYYYQIHISKNLVTRFYVQIKTIGAAYVTKNDDGTYDKTGTNFDIDTTYATGIDITALTSAGLGYTYAEGDFVRLIDSSDNVYQLSVIGQDGNYIFAKPTDVGTLSTTTTDFITELYTPYTPSTTEPLFETGDLLPILNPGENSRTYSVTDGSINGDCYALERGAALNEYFVEAMSPNDNKWQIWNTDTGWTNFITSSGQEQKETNIDWSDTYIDGTQTNGINIFQPLNTRNIGNSSGAIQKLQLTNKMTENGTVMLVITETETLSAYLGERQLVASAQNDALVQVDEVIGTINSLKKSRGTLHPESVIEIDGIVQWFDVINGKVVQYGTNGIVDISSFKMTRFFDRYAKRYIEQGRDAIEALCGFSYISACFDPSSTEALFTLPQVETNTVTSGIPVGFAPALPSYTTLPDYATSIQNRFDIYDGQPKTMVFNYLNNRWHGAYLWLPDCMQNIGNKLFGWKDGELWLFNENTSSFNVIFGTDYPQRICSTWNIEPNVPKDVMDIAVEANAAPSYTVLYADYQYEQITDLTEDDYTDKEGVFYAQFFMDRLSPNVSGSVIEKMYNGDNIKDVTPKVMIEFQEYESYLEINFVNVGMELSRGHTNILNK